MKFVEATDADKEYFLRLNRLCYEDVVQQQFGPWDEAHQNHSFESKWSDNNFQKIYVNDKLVGAIWVDDNTDFRQIREVQIHPDFQGDGIGTAAIRLEIESAGQAGKPLRLRVLFQNKALSLYERLGFKIIDKNEHQFIMEI